MIYQKMLALEDAVTREKKKTGKIVSLCQTSGKGGLLTERLTNIQKVGRKDLLERLFNLEMEWLARV